MTLGSRGVLDVPIIVGFLVASILAFEPAWQIRQEMERYDVVLVNHRTPYGMQNVMLSASRQRARLILDAWALDFDFLDFGARPPLHDARRRLALDAESVWPNARFLLLLGTFACAWAYLRARGQGGFRDSAWPWCHWGGIVIAIGVFTWADIAENRWLEQLLGDGPPWNLDSLTAVRLFAQLKLTTLMILALGMLLAVLLGIRRLSRWLAFLLAVLRAVRPLRRLLAVRPLRRLRAVLLYIRRLSRLTDDLADAAAEKRPHGSFEELIAAEHQGILGSHRDSPPRFSPKGASEPWVAWCPRDLVGLALSGGGIRSATFNLGLLQGLHKLGILRLVDYLATVSGGGYVGGAWSKLLCERERDRSVPDVKKSTKAPSGDHYPFETPVVRHLREFDKFLVPRFGVFDSETWGAVVAIVASVGPACLAALSVLGLSLLGWLALTFFLACPDPWGRAVFMGGLTAAVFAVMEWRWRVQPTGEPGGWGFRRVVITSAVAVFLVGCFAWVGGDGWSIGEYDNAKHTPLTWSTVKPSYETWWTLLGITAPGKGLVFTPRLYEPALVWGGVALLLVACRFRGAFARPTLDRRVMLPAADRTAMRLLGLATGWAVLATFWHVGLNLRGIPLLAVTVSAGGTGSLFVLLRNWMGSTLARLQTGRILGRLKPHIPPVLAYATVALAWSALASGLISWGNDEWFRWYQAAFAMGALVTAVLLVDPQEFGLHAFYRDRICRAYLGAVQPRPAEAAKSGETSAKGNTLPDSITNDNRQTDIRRGDDIAMKDLRDWPLHLVCCAANDLSGDRLATLSRGARSAVLSKYGVAMGDDWASYDGLQLGSALTASAAAFNSNMGLVSMRVGPAVSFLMSAFNLRLGLWVPSPKWPNLSWWPRLLPGWLFFREMFSWTNTTGSDLHLSDGAHFDNLGLYELVRRHCRYIIVSDCTADPKLAFDDFGLTVRRIREDFGLEIDVDLEPLKPGPDHGARQAAVVGTIDYGQFDKGVLVYIKPALTGTEPPDIRQYKTRNERFPHESTGDQFYDEAQWESYRRLGEHVAVSVFAFSKRLPGGPERCHAQDLFGGAQQQWYPAPAGLVDRSLAMGARFSQLEEELRAGAPIPILIEAFPELGLWKSSRATGAERTRDDELANLGCLLRILQLMEDATLACALETHWNHPLNLGWVNAFARWATAPTFQMWWPLLKTMYGPRLRTFLEDRFGALRDRPASMGQISTYKPEPEGPGTSDLAYRWWRERGHGHAPNLANLKAGRTAFEYRIGLRRPDVGTFIQMQVGLVVVNRKGDCMDWTGDEFFVPPSLWGAGMGHAFLRKLIDRLRHEGISLCQVTVKGPGVAMIDRSQWEESRYLIDFYRQCGFQLKDNGAKKDSPPEAILSLQLNAVAHPAVRSADHLPEALKPG